MSGILVAARPIGCQQLQMLAAGVQPARGIHLFENPSGLSLTVKSVLGSSAGALGGAAVGLMVDQAYCQRHHADKSDDLFGPCFAYAGEATAIGWFGGTVLGATIGAVRVAEQRGCPRRTAILRAAAGAAIGAAPGIMIVAPRSGEYPPSRSAFIFAAPVLSGLGAAAAVAGCHGARADASRQ